MSPPRSIGVVGANAAGLATARALRGLGYSGRLMLIDEDGQACVQRPPLSKAVLAGDSPQAYRQISDDDICDLELDLLLGVRVRSLETGALALDLGARPLPFDRVVLATGAAPLRPKLPGADLPGVHVLRTVAHAARLAADLKPGARLAIVGGGVIGAEVASTARALGCIVTLVEAQPELMVRVFGRDFGRLLRQRHVDAGVDVRLGRSATRILGADAVAGLELDDGSRLDADTVLIAVGAAPRVEIAQQAELACNAGVCVNDAGLTSHPLVGAAGDVARFTDGPFAGLRFEQQQSAEEQGARLASSLLGAPAPPWSTPYVWSDQLGGVVQLAGRIPPDAPLLVRLRADSDGLLGFHLQNGRLAAVLGFDAGRDFGAARRLIGAAVDPAQLCDPSTSLRDLAAKPAVASPPVS